MSSADKQALLYLESSGFKDIAYRRKTPCFSTDHGYFEARHGYINKLGDIIILLSADQRRLIQKHGASILVFTDKTSSIPTDIVKSFETDQVRARSVVFHERETSKDNRVFTRLTELQCSEIDRLVRTGEYESTSSFLRVAAIQLLKKHEQVILT